MIRSKLLLLPLAGLLGAALAGCETSGYSGGGYYSEPPRYRVVEPRYDRDYRRYDNWDGRGDRDDRRPSDDRDRDRDRNRDQDRDRDANRDRDRNNDRTRNDDQRRGYDQRQQDNKQQDSKRPERDKSRNDRPSQRDCERGDSNCRPRS
ncbi:hypothetical protein [Mycoplana rhizolycopersici]|uniref:Lipoprotein n=1 Tax=Mycoplana rhizolycopersici TaxID=2746702 RepID=A0ABX2QB54_9HYPH|nr:hypothetical protein [Rhizobium rhizolycopersici]NVP54184.1 hypothetical protein [Rhizobium rhizolycopersici]